MDKQNNNQVISDIAHPSQGSTSTATQETPLAPNTQIIPEEKPVEPAPNGNPTNISPKEKKDSSNIRFTAVIIIAIIVALGLVAVAYVAFVQQDSSSEDLTQTNQQTQQPELAPIDESTIDQESAQIDGIINELNDESDFPDSELEDSNLGL